jgi:hypothetical protein
MYASHIWKKEEEIDVKKFKQFGIHLERWVAIKNEQQQ